MILWALDVRFEFFERFASHRDSLGIGDMAEKLPVIIDNRGENKLLQALRRLLPHLQRMDVATGVFEIGSFLLLEGLWQELDRIRILMGDV